MNKECLIFKFVLNEYILLVFFFKDMECYINCLKEKNNEGFKGKE